MDKQFHPTLYCECDYFSMLELDHFSERDPWSLKILLAPHPCRSLQLIWRPGASWWNTRYPNSCSDFTLSSGTRRVVLVKTTRTVHRLSLQRRHGERDGVSNDRRLDCLLRRLFRRILKQTSKLRVTGLCEGNSPVTGEFPTQRATNAEIFSIWWRHHD